MSDPEVQKLLGELYGLAEVIAAMVTIKDSNKQLGVIDQYSGKVQNGIK